MRLVLASTSPSRRRILRMAGIEPVLLAPGVDEEAVAAAAGDLDAAAHVQLLATVKARAVLPQVVAGGADALVLGGDSAFVLDGEILGKPHRPEVAVERWRAMRGRTGTLLTGHCLIEVRDGRIGREAEAVAGAEVSFADVTDREIDDYVASGEPLSVAGAFTLEGRGAAFITRVVGDPHAVVGLSVAVLRSLAARLGTEWPDLLGGGHGGGTHGGADHGPAETPAAL